MLSVVYSIGYENTKQLLLYEESPFTSQDLAAGTKYSLLLTRCTLYKVQLHYDKPCLSGLQLLQLRANKHGIIELL